MTQSTLGIDVKAHADFSDVERAAAKAARSVSSHFHSAAPAPRAAGGFGRVFRDAARDVGDLERRLESLKRSAAGLDLLDRVRRSGQDPNKPGAWNWDRLGYGHGVARDAIRRRFEAGWDHVPVASAGPSVWRERAASVGQTAGTVAGQSAASFATGLTGLRMPGLGKAALIGTVAMGALSAGAAVKRGYEEHLRVIEEVDGAFKAMQSTLGFDGLVESVRILAQTLDLTSEEGARLAATYQKQSGALDSDMVARAETAGALGRGLGLDPNVSAGFMARAELLGVGGNKAQQREFAATLAHGIAQSGMGGRSEQYLEMMVSQIEGLAQSQARAMSMSEIGRYNELMGGLLANPALRGGGAQSIYSALKSEGAGGGLLQEALQWQMFGGAAGNNPALVKLLGQLEPHQSLYDILGSGSKTTRMQMTEPWARQYAAQYGGDPLLAEAYLMELTYGTPMPVTIAKRRQMDQLKASGIDQGAFTKWAASQLPAGMSLDDIDPSGFGNLAKLYAGRNDTSADYEQWMRTLGEEYVNDKHLSAGARGRLEEALRADDIKALRSLLPEIAASAGQQRTDADRVREANSDLAVGIERLGSEALEASLAVKKMQEALTEAAQWVTDHLKGAADATPQVVGDVIQGLSDQGDQYGKAVVNAIASKSDEVLTGVIGAPVNIGLGKRPPNLRVSGEARKSGALNVDPMLLEGARLAAMANPTTPIQITSGRNARPHNEDSLHPSGRAIDLRIWKDGKWQPNLRNVTPEAARMYEKIGQDMWALTGQPVVWGGYFKSGKWYMDAMHYQIGGSAAGGNLATGATPDWNARYGNFSQGWIGGSIESHREHLFNTNPGLREEVDRQRKAGVLKYHTGGLVRPVVGFGAEVPAILQVGEEVLTDRDPRHRKNLPPATAGRMSPEHAINARWQGALEMNVVFRDARGNVVQQRNALAVSEPRIPGSGPAQRWSWSDSVLMPS